MRAGSNSGPDIGAAVTADRADEEILQIRGPEVTGPKVRIHCDRMRTAMIAAIDDEPAGLRHFSDGDFPLAWHRRNFARIITGWE